MSPVNTDELELALMLARQRVLKIQTKLHRWARDDLDRRFDDLFNLVADPAFVLVAWDRVSGNKGAATAGVDRRTASSITAGQGIEVFLDELRSQLKDRSFRPLPVRERMIPKTGGALRRLGIPTVADRVVQASLKLVLEPIFEADFLPCSYGFRPKRRAHDAVAEVRYLATRPRCYDWVVEGDIKACFDEIDHTALMGRVRRRVGDNRVLGLVKAFLKAGILTEDGLLADSTAGTPQGGILSPLLANVALSVLDEHIAGLPGGPATGSVERARRLRHGQPNFRLVRYADDWCLMVRGTRAHAEALQEDIAAVLATMGLRLAPDKTLITHIDEGLDFLGGASSVAASGAPAAATSMFIRPRRPCWRSNGRSRRCAEQLNSTSRSMTCCAASTRRCRDGRAISGPGCPRRPSPTSVTTRGRRCGAGSDENTASRPGKTCAANIAAAAGGQPPRTVC